MLHLVPTPQKKDTKNTCVWDLDTITLLVVIVTAIPPNFNVCLFSCPLRSVEDQTFISKKFFLEGPFETETSCEICPKLTNFSLCDTF